MGGAEVQIRGAKSTAVITGPVDVNVLDTPTVVTSISGNIVQISGQCVCTSVSGDIVQISGQIVTAIVSGITVNISGISINISGNIVQISGQGVTTSVSGNIVQISGQCVCTSVSGDIVQISGETVIAKISGETVLTSVSGNIVQISGQEVTTSISGDIVIAKISGETIIARISGQTVITSVSGNIVQISGQFINVEDINPKEKAVIHNVALPAANTDWLGADLTPTNTPTTFRIMVSVSKVGKFSAAITRAAVTLVSTFNGGANLVADALFIFELLVHSGDTINFRYSVTGGTINELRVQEIDDAVA